MADLGMAVTNMRGAVDTVEVLRPALVVHVLLAGAADGERRPAEHPHHVLAPAVAEPAMYSSL